MSIFFIFLIGLFFGSFLNVLADRLPNDKSILGRSNCEYCKHALSPLDLIPLISFLFLKGKCRYCHKKLSLGYPLSEIFTAVLFSLTFALVNLKIFIEVINPETIFINDLFSIITVIPFTWYTTILHFFALAITSIFIVIFLADYRYGIIPDKITLVGLVLTLVYLLIISPSLIPNHVLAALGASLFFYIIYAFSRGRGIGFGDVKLGLLMGLLLGFPDILLALYLAFLTGGVSAIILVLWKKKKMKSTIAFGPFLVLGTYLSFFLSLLLIPGIMALL